MELYALVPLVRWKVVGIVLLPLEAQVSAMDSLRRQPPLFRQLKTEDRHVRISPRQFLHARTALRHLRLLVAAMEPGALQRTLHQRH